MATIFDRVVYVKLETTPGVDAVPVAANAVQVLSVDVTPTQDAIDRHVVKPTMGMKPHAQGKRTLEFKIKCELKGSGTAGTAPEISPLLQACYMSETLVPAAGANSAKVDYIPVTRNNKTCTIYVYKDGLLWKGIGAIGNANINANVAESTVVEFTMKCLYTDPTPATAPASPIFDATGPIVVSNADIVNENVGTIKCGSFALDIGNQLAEHYTTSQHRFSVADRAPVFSITKDSISTAAEWNALRNGDTAVIVGQFGSIPGNKLVISAQNCVRETVAYNERSEVDILDVAYRAYEVGNAGDDQFKITFL